MVGSKNWISCLECCNADELKKPLYMFESQKIWAIFMETFIWIEQLLFKQSKRLDEIFCFSNMAEGIWCLYRIISITNYSYRLSYWYSISTATFIDNKEINRSIAAFFN